MLGEGSLHRGGAFTTLKPEEPREQEQSEEGEKSQSTESAWQHGILFGKLRKYRVWLTFGEGLAYASSSLAATIACQRRAG